MICVCLSSVVLAMLMFQQPCSCPNPFCSCAGSCCRDVFMFGCTQCAQKDSVALRHLFLEDFVHWRHVEFEDPLSRFSRVRAMFTLRERFCSWVL